MIEIHQGKFNEGEMDPVNASGHSALKMEKLCNDILLSVTRVSNGNYLTSDK